MKRFIVIESTDNYMGEMFEIETSIRTNVELPFTKEVYRCVMHNGIDVELVCGEKKIKGTTR